MSGSLSIPFTFGSASGNVPASRLDTDYSTIATYVNAREVTVGLIGARPAAGTAGRWYLATDVSGGTLYVDTGTTWQQAGAAVTGTGSTPTILSGQGGDSALTGSVVETSLKSFTVTAGQLATNADALRILTSFRTSGAAGTKHLRVKFGATTIADSTAVTLNSGELAWVEGRVIRLSGTTQRATTIGLVSGPTAAWTTTIAGGVTSTAPGETLAGAVVVDVTGQLGNAADTIVCDYLSVEYVKAV